MSAVRRFCWIPIVLTLAACGGTTTDSKPSGNAAAPAAPVSSAKAPDEQAALDAIGKIKEAQATYFKLNRRYALTFDELTEAHLLNSEPAAARTGYDFNLRPAADAQTYKLSVAPAAPSATARHFFTDQSGDVHAETGKDATSDSPKI
jgi:type II secretory pathway pseudopilin PulG